LKGKEADFTILESDPYKVSPDAITDIKVSETLVAGSGSSPHDAAALRLEHISHGVPDSTLARTLSVSQVHLYGVGEAGEEALCALATVADVAQSQSAARFLLRPQARPSREVPP
jgi:hypothetical protein